MANDQIKDVPAEEVGNQVQELVDSDGVTSVTCTQQPDGKWTIAAKVL